MEKNKFSPNQFLISCSISESEIPTTNRVKKCLQRQPHVSSSYLPFIVRSKICVISFTSVIIIKILETYRKFIFQERYSRILI